MNSPLGSVSAKTIIAFDTQNNHPVKIYCFAYMNYVTLNYTQQVELETNYYASIVPFLPGQRFLLSFDNSIKTIL